MYDKLALLETVISEVRSWKNKGQSIFCREIPMDGVGVEFAATGWLGYQKDMDDGAIGHGNTSSIGRNNQ